VTIHQLPERCWVTDPAIPGSCDEPHYDSGDEAGTAIAVAREDDPGLKATVRQLDAPCWLVQCDGDCETTLDEEGECFVMHFDSRQDAETSMASYDWTVTAGPISGDDLVYCDGDRPGDVPLPPPSPAELEAAGQLRLPGVAR
jgi:hypothetical protein